MAGNRLISASGSSTKRVRLRTSLQPSEAVGPEELGHWLWNREIRILILVLPLRDLGQVSSSSYVPASPVRSLEHAHEWPIT